MEKSIHLPNLEEDVDEVEVSQWFVKKGDDIKIGDPLIEILVDKAIIELESEYAGKILELKVEEGEIISVNSEIAVIEVQD